MNLNDVCIDSLLSNSTTPLTADFHSPLKSVSTVPSSFAAGRKPVNYELGPKGSIVKKQLNPRKVDKKSDSFYEDILISRYFNGDQKQGREFIDLFRIRDKAGDRLANGMLCTLKQMGCKRTIMERVFGIGGYRYDHLDIERAQRTYQNSNAMTPSEIAMLQVARDSIPIADEGYACNHRQYMFYIDDPEITSVEKIYQKYYVNNPLILGRKMAKDTFRRYWNALHSDLRFKKLKEDECDTCIILLTGLKVLH